MRPYSGPWLFKIVSPYVAQVCLQFPGPPASTCGVLAFKHMSSCAVLSAGIISSCHLTWLHWTHRKDNQNRVHKMTDHGWPAMSQIISKVNHFLKNDFILLLLLLTTAFWGYLISISMIYPSKRVNQRLLASLPLCVTLLSNSSTPTTAERNLCPARSLPILLLVMGSANTHSVFLNLSSVDILWGWNHAVHPHFLSYPNIVKSIHILAQSIISLLRITEQRSIVCL